MYLEGDIVKSKTVHAPFVLKEETVRRFTEALNIYLVNLTADEMSMPIIVKIESIMGSYRDIVHPAMKKSYTGSCFCDASIALFTRPVRR